MITVCIIDDDTVTRENIFGIIERAPGFVRGGSYGSCEEAFQEIPRKRPDVILLDVGLPGGISGTEGVKVIKHQWPEIEVIMVTVHLEDETLFQCLRNGASGYLLKGNLFDDITKAIQEVVDGGAPMSMAIARKVADSFRTQPTAEPLTRRENEVLTRLWQGQSYKAIAEELFVSRETVKFHIKNIYRKLNVSNRVEAILKKP